MSAKRWLGLLPITIMLNLAPSETLKRTPLVSRQAGRDQQRAWSTGAQGNTPFAFDSFEQLVAFLPSEILGTEKLKNNQDSAR